MRDYDFKTRVERDQLLAKLKENRDNHQKIYREAVEGFVAKARDHLNAKLDQLANGKIKNLSVSLHPPDDHTAEYNTAIQMVEWTTEEEIELNASEFRNFVMDEWDWIGHWLIANRRFSKTATEYAELKGIE